MVEQNKYYHAKCPHCGQVDVVYGGQKTHKCSSCKQRNTLDFSDPSCIIGEAPNPFGQTYVSSPVPVQQESQPNFKKLLKYCLIAGVVIALIFTLFETRSDTDSSAMEGVRTYLMNTLKDPGSYQDIEWSPVGKNDAGRYYIRHKYRAKNSFGGYVVEEKIFYLDDNFRVVGSQDY